jgi:hypothetical protein
MARSRYPCHEKVSLDVRQNAKLPAVADSQELGSIKKTGARRGLLHGDPTHPLRDRADDARECASSRPRRGERAQSAVPAIGASEGPSIKKKDQPAPSYNEQRRFDRFNDAVAFKVAFDRPDDAQGDDEDPPVPSHQVE